MGMKIPAEWTFQSADVAADFDRHVREQLPWYDLVTGMVAHIARHYIPLHGLVYDIGASTGNIGRAIGPILDNRFAHLIAIDSSKAMQARYCISHASQFVLADIKDFEFEDFDLAVAFLSLMFLSPENRRVVLSRLRNKLRSGGAIIVVDKCAPSSGYLGVVMARLTLATKLAAGAEPADILAKELSLAGIQRPLLPDELGDDAQEVFRFGDFAGWVIE